jgi:hypothetical protein
MSSSSSSSSSDPKEYQQHRQVVTEDGPEYRSVQMMGPLTGPPMPRFVASIAPPPPMKFSAKPSKTAFQDDRKQIRSSSPTAWKVVELTSLPTNYLLERTNVSVENTTPQVVADRIVDCLRLMSIASSTTNNSLDDYDIEVSRHDRVNETSNRYRTYYYLLTYLFDD